MRVNAEPFHEPVEAFALTVRGPVPVAQLGITDAHEHLLADATPELVAADPDLHLGDPARATVDLAEFKAAGGGCIVEMTTVDYGRRPLELARMSEVSGLHIIAATGFNKGDYARPFCEHRSPEAVAARSTADVQDGVGDSNVRCGVVKFGTSLDTIEPWEAVAARAAAITHRRTGCPIVTHTQAGTMAREQLDLLEDAGVAASAVVVCHMDRRPDADLHAELASRGAFLCYDQIPKARYATAEPVISLVRELAERGLHSQVLLGGDLARRSYFRGWGGGPGLRYLVTSYRKRLHDELETSGLPGADIVDDLFVNNPARALAFRPPSEVPA